MRYAVIQLGYCIFGTGDTKEEAIQDARSRLSQNAEITDCDGCAEMDGALYVIECTESLFNAVEDRGGDIPYAITSEGVVCLPSELD